MVGEPAATRPSLVYAAVAFVSIVVIGTGVQLQCRVSEERRIHKAIAGIVARNHDAPGFIAPSRRHAEGEGGWEQRQPKKPADRQQRGARLEHAKKPSVVERDTAGATLKLPQERAAGFALRHKTKERRQAVEACYAHARGQPPATTLKMTWRDSASPHPTSVNERRIDHSQRRRR